MFDDVPEPQNPDRLQFRLSDLFKATLIAAIIDVLGVVLYYKIAIFSLSQIS